jgi:hypothetical protein
MLALSGADLISGGKTNVLLNSLEKETLEPKPLTRLSIEYDLLPITVFNSD